MTIEEMKLKHLEFIQSVINRMANNSFLIKGWAITLVSAIFALSAAEEKLSLLKITYIAMTIFWILDGFYLHQERAYRGLYDEVRAKTQDIDFSLNAKAYEVGKNSWFCSTVSKTLVPFYFGTMLVIGFVMYWLGRTNG